MEYDSGLRPVSAGAVSKGRRKRGRPRKMAASQNDLATRDVNIMQQSTDLLLKKLPFSRLVRDVALEVCEGEEEVRWQSTALLALQEATEFYLIGLFQHANLCCLHANRVTLMVSDVRLARRIIGRRG